jgi:alpha-D-ribose 1-methylphosphonate 5-triphosphate synthase subunit PhnG
MVNYTEILSKVASGELLPWELEIIKMGHIEIVNPPTMGLVMMRSQESVEGVVFNVGELLISESTLSVDGVIGCGVIMGNDVDNARRLALIDAVTHNSDPKWSAWKERFEAWITEQREQQIVQQEERFKLIARTKVDFELMDSEQEEEA